MILRIFDRSDDGYAKREAVMKRIGYMLVADVALMAGLTFISLAPVHAEGTDAPRPGAGGSLSLTTATRSMRLDSRVFCLSRVRQES